MKTRKSEFVSGVDSYNLCLTGNVGRTLATPSGGLNEHIPVILGCDMYNFQITGDIAANLNASSCNSPTHSGPSVLIKKNVVCASFMGGQGAKARSIAYYDDGTTPTIRSSLSGGNAIPEVVILNDQGGDVMHITEDVTHCIRAQDHGHPPVVCFEPGIMSRDCSAGNRAYIDICSTLRAQMGDNQPAICYEVNNE